MSSNPDFDRWYAAKSARFLVEPSHRLATFGNTLVNFAIASIGYRLFAAAIPCGGVLAVPVMTVGLLVFGEITPKQIALRYAEELAHACARLLLFWRTVLAPSNFVLKSVSRAFRGALRRERRALSDEELLSVLEASAERGDFVREDAEMIEGVLRLSELCANDEMTPRVDMQTYDVDLPSDMRETLVKAAKHRYLPVINRSPDVVMGVYDRETGKTCALPIWSSRSSSRRRSRSTTCS